MTDKIHSGDQLSSSLDPSADEIRRRGNAAINRHRTTGSDWALSKIAGRNKPVLSRPLISTIVKPTITSGRQLIGLAQTLRRHGLVSPGRTQRADSRFNQTETKTNQTI